MSKIRTEKNIAPKTVILEKAAGLFKTKGFAATSMRELASELGIEAPSLYNHIGSKDELLQEICFKVANSFILHLTKVENLDQSIIRKVELLIRFHIKMTLENFDEVFVANHEWRNLQEPYLKKNLTLRRNYEKRLVSLIQNGIEKKEFSKINPQVAALTILAALRSLEFWQRHKKNISEKTLEDTIVHQLLNGIIQ